MTFFQGDVTTLSDAELRALAGELEDACVSDHYNYPEDSWEYQSAERSFQLQRELNRRWRLANPEAAAKSDAYYRPFAEIVAAEIERLRPEILSMFEKSDQISALFRKGA